MLTEKLGQHKIVKNRRVLVKKNCTNIDMDRTYYASVAKREAQYINK